MAEIEYCVQSYNGKQWQQWACCGYQGPDLRSAANDLAAARETFEGTTMQLRLASRTVPEWEAEKQSNDLERSTLESLRTTLAAIEDNLNYVSGVTQARLCLRQAQEKIDRILEGESL